MAGVVNQEMAPRRKIAKIEAPAKSAKTKEFNFPTEEFDSILKTITSRLTAHPILYGIDKTKS